LGTEITPNLPIADTMSSENSADAISHVVVVQGHDAALSSAVDCDSLWK